MKKQNTFQKRERGKICWLSYNLLWVPMRKLHHTRATFIYSIVDILPSVIWEY